MEPCPAQSTLEGHPGFTVPGAVVTLERPPRPQAPMREDPEGRPPTPIGPPSPTEGPSDEGPRRNQLFLLPQDQLQVNPVRMPRVPIISYLPVVFRMPLHLLQDLHPDWPLQVTYGSYLNVEVPEEALRPVHQPGILSFPIPNLLLSVTDRTLGVGFEGYPPGSQTHLQSPQGYLAGGVLRDGRLEPLPVWR